MALILKMSDLYDKSITDVFWSPNMDYSKYLHCHACRESGLYCPKHRIEVGQFLGNERLGKHCKFVTISQLDTSMQSKVC